MEICQRKRLTIVTQDNDFDDMYGLWGHPPKIIMIRTGNVSNVDLAKLLISRKDRIERFINNTNILHVGRLEITHIEVV